MLAIYVLDDAGNPVPEDDVSAWSQWSATTDRHVGDDMINGVRVSTVFLGIDHAFFGGPPVLWETMIFGSEKWEDVCERYTSRGAALAGHTKWCEAVISGNAAGERQE